MRVEQRGLEPRSLLCKSSVRPLNYHPEMSGPRDLNPVDRSLAAPGPMTWAAVTFCPRPVAGQAVEEDWHDVKDLNPLDGSFGGSPVAADLRRMSPPLPLRRRRSVSLGRSSQPFGSLFLSISYLVSGAASGIRTRDRLVNDNHHLSAPRGKSAETVYANCSSGLSYGGESGAGGIRTRSRQSDNLVTFLFRPVAGRVVEEGDVLPLNYGPTAPPAGFEPANHGLGNRSLSTRDRRQTGRPAGGAGLPV